MDCSIPGFLPFTVSQHLWMIHLHHPLSRPLFLPSVFPSIKVFSNESALCIRWPKHCCFNVSICPSNENSRLISFQIDWFDLLAVQATLRVFSSTTVWKHQFFGSQFSLWSNCNIHTWLLEKPWLWLYGPLSTNSYCCFLVTQSCLTLCNPLDCSTKSRLTELLLWYVPGLSGVNILFFHILGSSGLSIGSACTLMATRWQVFFPSWVPFRAHKLTIHDSCNYWWLWHSCLLIWGNIPFLTDIFWE